MDNIFMNAKRSFFLFFLLLASTSVYAQDRAAAYASCVYNIRTYPTTWVCETMPGVSPTASTGEYYAHGEGMYQSKGGAFDSLCSNGGTWNNTTHLCVLIPVCIAPQQLNLSTNTCYTPLECIYPETDNGNHVCQDNQCPTGQTRNPVNNLCQVKPVCGSTETYSIVQNQCILYPLGCPLHSHANSTNDKCLADKPNTCPIGQHDDGTYTCVANDATACKSNQTSGSIFGVAQCINKPNNESFAQQAKDAEANRAVKSQAEQTALDAKKVADAALAADPTNTVKQTAATTATATYTTAQIQSTAALSAEKAVKDNADTTFLGSIAKDIQEINDKDNATAAAGFSPLPTPDTIDKRNVAINTTLGGFAASGSCPAPTAMVLSFGTLSMSNQMYCDFASQISVFILGAAWLGAAYIVFKGA